MSAAAKGSVPRIGRCRACNNVVHIRTIEPAVDGGAAVDAYMCGICDRRQCKCGLYVRDAKRVSCRCGRNLRAAV